MHTRRYFEKAKDIEPLASAWALELIGLLYQHEKTITERQYQGAEKQQYRTEHSLPLVEQFFAWCDQQSQRQDLLPSNPLTKALAYAKERVTEL